MLRFCHPRLANQLRDLHQQGQGNVQNLPVINSEDIRKAKGVLRNIGRANLQPQPHVNMSVEPKDGRTGGLFSIQPNMPALIPALRPKCSSATATQREEKLPRWSNFNDLLHQITTNIMFVRINISKSMAYLFPQCVQLWAAITFLQKMCTEHVQLVC